MSSCPPDTQFGAGGGVGNMCLPFKVQRLGVDVQTTWRASRHKGMGIWGLM